MVMLSTTQTRNFGEDEDFSNDKVAICLHYELQSNSLLGKNEESKHVLIKLNEPG